MGQLWHAGQNGSKEIIEESISNNKIEVRIFRYILKRNSKKNKIYYWHRNKTTCRTLKRYTFKHYSNSNNILLEKFYTDVTYDNFIKVLSKECDSYRNGDCSVIKKYVKVQNYILVFIRKESVVLNTLGKDLLHIRAVKQI